MTLLSSLLVLSGTVLHAQGPISFGSAFQHDDEKRSFFFTLSTQTTSTFRTYSYAGGTDANGNSVARGGFDPTLSLFDAAGNLIANSRDGGCGVVAADSNTGTCWDAAITITLPAGGYQLVLTIGDNLPIGPTLADGFLYDGQGDFTTGPGGIGPPGLWDASGTKRTGTYDLSFTGPPTVTPQIVISRSPSPGNGQVGVAYSHSFASTGGTGTVAWTYENGTLPPGLALSGAGVLSGTPTAYGTYNFTVVATDSAIPPAVDRQAVQIVIAPAALVISTATLPTWVSQTAFSVQFGATGGVTPYTWSAPPIANNGVLSISASGLLTGTPTGPGSTTISVQVTDAQSVTTTKQFSWQVVAPSVIVPNSLPAGITGQTYSPFTMTSTDGAPNAKTWSFTQGSLPSGMSFSAAGVLSGTPGARGAFPLTIQVNDGVRPVTKALTLDIYDPLVITTSSLPGGTQGQAYGPVAISTTGGSGNLTFTGTGLPPGVSISPAGQLSGPLGSGGAFNVTITATDNATGQVVTKGFSITIGFPQITLNGVSDIGTSVGTSISCVYLASGGRPPYTWSATGLPPGVSMDAGGTLSGAPSAPGRFSFTVTVTDSQGASSSAGASLSVLGIVFSGTLPPASTTSPYSQSFSVAGGTPPYSFVAAGLPEGLGIGSDGTLSGTPKRPGTFSFTVTVSDNGGASASLSLTLTVTAPPNLSVSPTSPPNGTVGSPYSETLAANGGSGAVTWSLAGGALPDGLSLAGSGTISGTPTKAGSFAFTARATDASGASATGGFSITIAPQPLTLSIGSAPNGIVGVQYPAQVITARGGTSPYKFTLVGSLPPGLSLADGQISGTPTSTGAFDFTINAEDASVPTLKASVKLTISVSANTSADLILSASSASFSLTRGAADVPASQAITVRSSVVEQPLGYSVALNPSVPWATISGGGNTPGGVTIGLTSAALSLAASPNPYTTGVTVSCASGSPCAGKTQTINVSLLVEAPPPLLSVGSGLISFSTTSSGNPSNQSFAIENRGGGSIGVRSISASASWVTLSGSPTAILPGVPANVSVGANTAGLRDGYYRATINIETSAGSAAIPLGLFISRTVSMVLSPGGAQFQMQAGGAPGNSSGSFVVSANSLDATSFSASVLPGAGWLTVSSGSGSASATSAGQVSFAIDGAGAAALEPGAYYGTIRVTSPQVANSPQDFSVILNVTPATAPATPDPQPAGLIFISSAPGALPQQVVRVFAGSRTPIPYQASASTDDGRAWLSVSPATGTTSASNPGQSTVTVNLAGLAQGVYRGGVSYAFSAASVRTVNVTLIVQAGGAAQLTTSLNPHANGCTPTRLVPTQTGLTTNFAQPAAWPTPLTIKLVDDCGDNVTSGQVVTTFSNGDPPLALSSIDKLSGVYAATWTPRATSSQISVTARATASGFAAATTIIKGQVTPNAAPALNPGGTLNAFGASVGAPLGPGSIIQVYGSNLSAQPTVASTLPLPQTLGGTRVLIGGKNAPLYFASPGQVNAQIPVDLAPNQQYQIVVSANGALSTPDTIQLTDVAPGIATFANGAVIAQHLDGSLVLDGTSPAKPGEIVIFYLSGLGVTDIPVGSGEASPGTVLAHPTVPLQLTLAGADAPVQFVGLTPGLVGLYQVNFKVPDTAPDGTLDLVIQQGDILANKTLLPVKK